MEHGTHYEQGKHNQYDECPKCHTRMNGKSEKDFAQYLDKEKERLNRNESGKYKRGN